MGNAEITKEEKNQTCFKANLFMLRAIMMCVAYEEENNSQREKKIEELYKIIGTTRSGYTRILDKEYKEGLPPKMKEKIGEIQDKGTPAYLLNRLIFDQGTEGKESELKYIYIYMSQYMIEHPEKDAQTEDIKMQKEETAYEYWTNCFDAIKKEKNTPPAIMRKWNDRWIRNVRSHIDRVRKNKDVTDVVFNIYKWLKRAITTDYTFGVQHQRLQKLNKITQNEFENWNIQDLREHARLARAYSEYVNATYTLRERENGKFEGKPLSDLS